MTIMDNPENNLNSNGTDQLFLSRYEKECDRVHWFICWLMVAQWFLGITFAVFYSPLTWIGQQYEVHVHVWAAILMGGSFSGFAILWLRMFPHAAHSRHVVAIIQMLWSALLIHLSGGRIETHFHVFASLAILSIYRDWKIMITATIVIALDHIVRGIFYPLSAFGIVTESPYRWIEHAAWVIFEVSFLVPGCIRRRNEIRELCNRQTEIEEAKTNVDRKVAERTIDLVAANQRLAEKTTEAEVLALVAKHTHNAVAITDQNGEITWVNDAFESLTGYERDEAKGLKVGLFGRGEYTDPETVKHMEQQLANGQGFDVELLQYGKSAVPYWSSLEVRPICDIDGSVTKFISIESNISERKRAELRLKKLAKDHQQQTSTLDAVLQSIPDGILAADENGNMICYNQRAVEMLGALANDYSSSADWPEDHGLFEVGGTELIANHKLPLFKAMNGETVKNREMIARKSDSDILISANARPLNSDATGGGGVCVFRDITKERQKENEMRSLRVAVDNANEAMFTVDSNGRFVGVNNFACQRLGYKRSELLELSVTDICKNPPFESWEEHWNRIKNQRNVLIETEYTTKNKEIVPIEVSLVFVTYGGSEFVFAFARDITERKSAETERERLALELQSAAREAGMAEIATGVLHNVGNILNSVNVSAGVIRRQFEQSALSNLEKVSRLIQDHQSEFADFVRDNQRGQKLPHYIQKVTEALCCERQQVNEEFCDLIKNIDHIKEIVTVQQSMAKSSGLQQELRVSDLIADTLTASKGSLARHGINIVQEIEDPDATIVSDKHKVLQILINLIKNAKDALVENATQHPEIKIKSTTTGDRLAIQVIDNGIGIPTDKINKIFQNGFTTKHSGHGFGLHSSANAATELGGSLTAASDGIGKGARFELCLPQKLLACPVG